MSALSLFRPRPIRTLASIASIVTRQLAPQTRCYSIYENDAERAAKYKREVAAVMADPKLDDLQKYRTSERLHALSDYHRTNSEMDTIFDKLEQERLKVAKYSVYEQGVILSRTTDPLWRGLLIKEEKTPALRSMACKLCLFAAMKDVGLGGRVIRAFDLQVVGWLV